MLAAIVGKRTTARLIQQSKRWSSSIPLNIKQLLANPPSPSTNLTVNGHVKSVRSLKKVAFVDLSDNSTNQQLMCVMSPSQAESLTTGESVSLTGEWKESKGKEQAFELNLINGSVKVLGTVPKAYPLQKKYHSLQYLRSLPSLRWRTSFLSSILRFRSLMDFKFNEFFHNEGFFKVNPPIITSSDCEGAGELFQLESKSFLSTDEKFFDKEAYLTVSTQLHLEVLSASLGKVWSLSPTFRAEASDTNRHLAEFWMLEAEVSYVESLDQLTQFIERMIKHALEPLVNDETIANDLLKCLPSEHSITEEGLRARWVSIYQQEWEKITYREAITILESSNKEFKIPVDYNDGLATEHEKYLAEEHFNNKPVFITDYPRSIKPFYMLQNKSAENSSKEDTVACFDLIFPRIGEIIGGSLREHNLEILKKEMISRGMKPKDMDWYLSTRENGSVPHGGFGLGFERLVCYLTGVENVRDVVPFPRARSECVA